MIKAIEEFVANWNSDCQPVNWTATADEILDKVRSIISHMELLIQTTEINDVTNQAS